MNMGVDKMKAVKEMLNNSIDVSSAYAEKIWGKESGKEYLIDGYVFRGKRLFGKAVTGLQRIMTKGSHGKINGYEYTSLDTRIVGTELSIDVEIKNEKQRGNAILKLYDTNKKKENVVMVSKSKQSEHEFVKLLAEKVVKPLMEGFMLDNDLQPERKISVKEKPNKCDVCGKTFASTAGVKGHKTRMHKNTRLTKEGKDTLKRKACNEEFDDMVNKVFGMSDDESSDEADKDKKKRRR